MRSRRSGTLHPSNTPILTTPPLRFGSASASLRKVWQFDFDPAAPKTNVHRYNSNRRESPSNFFGMPVFDHNRIYVAGGGDIWWGKNEAWLKCIDATRTGDITTKRLVWSYPLQKHVMSTPAVCDGLVFIADCGRTFHCVDAETGKPYWTHEVTAKLGPRRWSPTARSISARAAAASIYSPPAKKRQCSAPSRLGQPISSTATAANGVLYVATMNRLYAVRQ